MRMAIDLRAVSAVALVAGCMLALSQAKRGQSTGQETFGDGGPATAAAINGPNAVVVDGRNTLYVAEEFREVIRRVDLRTGVIGTVHTQEPLKVISGLALDSTGNLIVLDESRVRMVQVSDGSVKDIVAGQDPGWFSGDGGPAIAATLNLPRGVAFDHAGNLYIADTSNHRIRRVEASTGIIQTVAGNGTPGSSGDGTVALQAGLAYPDAVAIDEAGNLFISQSGYGFGESRIRRVDARTGVITTICGLGGQGLIRDGRPALTATLRSASNVRLDGRQNILFIDQGRVRSIDAKTATLHTIAGVTEGSGRDGGLATGTRLAGPSSIALDADGNLFIAEFVGNRVLRVDARTGIITGVAGNGLPHRADVQM
jgi:sugar lactone lactonase YvrE